MIQIIGAYFKEILAKAFAKNAFQNVVCKMLASVFFHAVLHGLNVMKLLTWAVIKRLINDAEAYQFLDQNVFSELISSETLGADISWVLSALIDSEYEMTSEHNTRQIENQHNPTLNSLIHEICILIL